MNATTEQTPEILPTPDFTTAVVKFQKVLDERSVGFVIEAEGERWVMFDPIFHGVMASSAGELEIMANAAENAFNSGNNRLLGEMLEQIAEISTDLAEWLDKRGDLRAAAIAESAD